MVEQEIHIKLTVNSSKHDFYFSLGGGFICLTFCFGLTHLLKYFRVLFHYVAVLFTCMNIMCVEPLFIGNVFNWGHKDLKHDLGSLFL